MIPNGVKPRKYKDHRKYSFTRTFGAISTFPPKYSVEFSRPMPNQFVDNLPNGCTGYAQTELCSDQDQLDYDPRFTYEKGLLIDGGNDGDGVQMDSSLKSLLVYGALPKGNPETDALNHRRGAYFEVDENNGLDHFDAIRNALMSLNRRAVSWATPWFQKWESIGSDGLIPKDTIDINDSHTWHNSAFVGWKTINGEPYLINKSWQGTGFGDNGYCYFSRGTVNTLMQITGSQADVVTSFTPTNVMTIQLTIKQTLISYIQRLISLLTKKLQSL